MRASVLIAIVASVACSSVRELPERANEDARPVAATDGAAARDAVAFGDAGSSDAVSTDFGSQDIEAEDVGFAADAEPAPDGGPPGDAGLSELCDQPPPGPDFQHQVFRFEGGGIVLVFTREFGGLGGGITSIWNLRRFTVERESRIECVTDPALLSYQWTHHNWADDLTATADGLRWTLSMRFDVSGNWTDQLEGTDPAGGQRVVGPVSMTQTAGPARR